jgi:hypothetical protein
MRDDRHACQRAVIAGHEPDLAAVSRCHRASRGDIAFLTHRPIVTRLLVVHQGGAQRIVGVPSITFPVVAARSGHTRRWAGMSYQEPLRDQVLAALGMTMIGITLHTTAGD